MIAIYSEEDIIDDIALFKEDFPQWNKIINSGIDICLNINDKKLTAKLSDYEDPLYLALQSSGSMKIPVALDNFFKQINEDFTAILDKPRSIFLLDIDEATSTRIQNDYGMAVYSVKNIPKTLFNIRHYKDLNKGEKINNGWKGVFQFTKPLSNSLIISDSHFFKNEDRDGNLGIANLIQFLDAYLPDKLAIEYHVTIFAENSNKSNEWWISEFGKLITKIKKLREFQISMELILYESIHPRKLISNYANCRTDQGFDIFYTKDFEKIRLDNEFEYNEIFFNLENEGTNHFKSVSKAISSLEQNFFEVSEYVKAKGNTKDRMLFGCNKDKSIKNRLLN